MYVLILFRPHEKRLFFWVKMSCEFSKLIYTIYENNFNLVISEVSIKECLGRIV